jgi:MFS family permease
MSEKAKSKTPWIILTILTALYALNFMDRMIVAVSMEAIKADFNFTDTQIGMVQSIFFLGVGLLTIPAGVLVDRWSRRKAISLMAVIWSLATAATGVSRNFVSILTSRFVVGAGEAGFHPGGFAWIADIFPKEKRATAGGIFQMGVIVGCIVGMVAGGWLITKTGDWRLVYYVFGIPGILLGVLVLFMPESVRQKLKPAGSSNVFKEMFSLFKIKTYLYNCFGSGLFMVLAATTQTWMAVLLMRAYNLNEAKAGGLLGIMIIPALLAPVMGGTISDRMQKRFVNGRSLFCAIASLVIALIYVVQFYSAGLVPLPVYIGISVAVALVSSAPIAVYHTIAQDVIPVDKRGVGASIVVFIQYALFTWWGSTLVGKVSDMLGGGAFGLRIALMTICPFTLVAAVLFLISAKHYQADSAKSDISEIEAESEKEFELSAQPT